MEPGLVPLLHVADMARSLDWYTRGLGFRVLQQWEDGGAVAWCLLQRGTARLMLQQAGDPATVTGGGPEMFIVVDEVDELRRALVARGIDAPAPDTAFYGMRQVELVDPDGYRLCFEAPVEGT